MRLNLILRDVHSTSPVPLVRSKFLLQIVCRDSQARTQNRSQTEDKILPAFLF